MAKKKAPAVTKLFVLDTNVLMHDPTCLFRFEEHDVFLPIITLEELDDHKKGMSEVARNARQASRFLDDLVKNAEGDIRQGISLQAASNKAAKGRLLLQTEILNVTLPANLPEGKADNQILGIVMALQRLTPERAVILVSKDINMRIKAATLGLAAEDYFNQMLWQASIPPFAARVIEQAGKTAKLETLKDYTHSKNNVWGITARNLEQNFALNLLMNPDIDFVSLLGQAGTGKTLLTLAAALAMTLEEKRYSEIIITRVTIPVGEDIGFLPGSEEEKMAPWMGALEDNLDVLTKPAEDAVSGGSDWGRAATRDLLSSRIKVKSLNFMRGRTFLNKFLIIDEAQNLTPKQMKTLITRAGNGTKVVCLGNLSQIDTPYLTEGSSGLTYVVDRMKGWAHAGHITLLRGERSRLADFAAEVL